MNQIKFFSNKSYQGLEYLLIPNNPNDYKMKNFKLYLGLSEIKDNQLYVSVDTNCPQSQLCSKHRCSSPDLCPKEVANSSAFCTSHSCRECISIKSNPIQAAVNKAPRNTCNKHQLCSFTSVKGKECILVAKGTSMYCLKHTEDLKVITRSQQKTTAPLNKTCASLNAKRQPCKNITGLELLEDNNCYCNSHKGQAKAKISKASTLLESSDSDSSENEEEEETETAANLPTELKPVLELVEGAKVFSKAKCSEKECNVVSLLKGDESVLKSWLCPVHQKPAHKDKKDIKPTVTAPLSVPIEKMESKLIAESCEADNKKEVFSALKELVVDEDVKVDEKDQKGKMTKNFLFYEHANHFFYRVLLSIDQMIN